MEGSPSRRRKTPISNKLVPQVGGWTKGSQFHSRKNTHVTETATEEINTTGCDGLPESSQDTCMKNSDESQKETTDRKMEVFSAKTKTSEDDV